MRVAKPMWQLSCAVKSRAYRLCGPPSLQMFGAAYSVGQHVRIWFLKTPA